MLFHQAVELPKLYVKFAVGIIFPEILPSVTGLFGNVTFPVKETLPPNDVAPDTDKLARFALPDTHKFASDVVPVTDKLARLVLPVTDALPLTVILENDVIPDIAKLATLVLPVTVIPEGKLNPGLTTGIPGIAVPGVNAVESVLMTAVSLLLTIILPTICGVDPVSYIVF